MTGFSRTLVFGALAAVSLPASVVILSPLLGGTNALALHGVAAVAGYLGLLAPDARRRIGVVVLAGVFGCVGWAVTGSLAALVIGLSLGVAIVRSAVFFGPRADQSWLRWAVVEAIVLVGGVLTVRFLAVSVPGPGPIGSMLALWGWFVAQSFYFLFQGFAPRRPRPKGDPFDVAKRGLEELLLPQAARADASTKTER